MRPSITKLMVKLCEPCTSPATPSSIATSDRHKPPWGLSCISWFRFPWRRHREDDVRTPLLSQLTFDDSESLPVLDNSSIPIHTLPPEILGEIFVAACHAESDEFIEDHLRHYKITPLTLGSVCRQWRSDVWSTPRIWSHVSLCVSLARHPTQTSLLADWLNHSGAYHLTINVCFEEEDDWKSLVPEDLVRTLASSADRWSAIDFVLPENWYPLLEPIKGKLQHLTKVSTQPLRSDCMLPQQQRNRFTLFETAPLLIDLHVNGYYLSDVFLQWHQLDRFSMQYVYPDECFAILPETPYLEWCRIHTILPNDAGRSLELPEKPIELVLLQTLVIQRSSSEDLLRLLKHLSISWLKELHLINMTHEIIFANLTPVLLKATEAMEMTRLRKLVLKELGCFVRPVSALEDDLRDFLAVFPLLEDLEIEVTSLLEAESVGICIWWFIDLLKVPLERRGGEAICDAQVAETLPQQLDCSIQEPNLTGVSEDLQNVRSPTTLPLPPSPSTTSCSTPPSSCSFSPYTTEPILPNLRNFSYIGPMIVMDHKEAIMTDDDGEDGSRPREQWNPTLTCWLPKRPGCQFGDALLEVLRHRRSCSNNAAISTNAHDAYSVVLDAAWTPEQLESFKLKAKSFHCLDSKSKHPSELVKIGLEALQMGSNLDISLGDIQCWRYPVGVL